MVQVILGFTISLDGFVTDSSGSVDSLYTDLVDWRETELGKESIQNTGAVVMGRNTFNMSEDPDWYAGTTSIRCRSLSLLIMPQRSTRKRRSH